MGQLDVLDGGLLGVPLRLHGIGRCQDGGAGVQLADDSRLKSQKIHELKKQLLRVKKKKNARE